MQEHLHALSPRSDSSHPRHFQKCAGFVTLHVQARTQARCMHKNTHTQTHTPHTFSLIKPGGRKEETGDVLRLKFHLVNHVEQKFSGGEKKGEK